MYEIRHPGAILKEEFLDKRGMSQKDLQRLLHSNWATINNLINCKSSIELGMACKLGKLFNVSPKWWINLQFEYDLFTLTHSEYENLMKTEKKLLDVLELIKPLST